MKKRVLSMLMALALCLTLLPASARAEETAGNVAEVTAGSKTTQYTNIVAAFTAAQAAESATVKLLENVTIPTDAEGYSYGIDLTSGNITLDLNGHTIQTTDGASSFVMRNAVFYIGGSGLTVQDSTGGGKIVQPNGGQAIGVSSGNLTVKSGIIEVTSDSADEDNATTTQNCAVFVRGNGVADIQGGTLIGNRGIYVGGKLGGGTLTVSGGTIHGKSSYALEIAGGSVRLSGGSYTTDVTDGCSIWNAVGTAGNLLASDYRYEYNGTECAYSEDGKGVAGNATVAPRPANEYAYIGKDGTAQTQANCTEITNRTDNISTPGWYVVKENLTISSLNISGEVNLILCDGATLTISDALTVENDAVLNLYFQSNGTGKLMVGNSTGTVTAPAGEMKQTNDSSGTTFEKCFEHDWKYTNNGDKHTAKCKLCGKAEAAESHKYDSWAHTDANTHTGTCACGATKTEDHTLTCTPNADGLTHSTKCSVCGYTAAAENHNFDQTDGYDKKCACGAYLAAEYNGQEYASLQAAINAAAADGGTVTLARDVSENVTVAGGTVTVDLSGKNWRADIRENHDLWGRIPLTVTGGSVTLQNGTLDQGRTSSAGSYGVRIQGGSVTVKGNAVVIGSNTTGSAANISYPAIILKSGDLTLETGATLVHGLEVPEDKHLSDYLPEGTAFGLRGYDESTGTLTGDKRLFADAYTTNAYNIPNMALVVETHKHTFAAGTTKCECGFTCAQHDWSKKNGVCTVCGSACPHNAGAAEADGVWACNTCGQTVTAKVVAPDGSTTTYYADGYVNNNVKSGLYFAIKAAETGSTVTALGGGKPAGGYVKNGKSLTLDVSNGKTIDGILNVGYTNPSDTGNTLIVIGSAEISYVIVDPGNTLDLTGWTGRIGSLTVQNGGKATLNGGTFATLYINGATAGSLLAEGYAFQNADNGAYVEYSSTADMENVKVVKCPHSGVTLKDDLTGVKCKYCGASFAATLDDAPYGTIDAAVSAWLANGGTLKLYADYTAADGTWSVGSGPHTVDLNGHRMSVKGDGAFKPTNNMHLTVTDGKEIGQITNILLDGSQGGSFTLESGYVGEVGMTGGAVVALKGGRVDNLDVKNCSENTNLSIQGGSLGKLNIEDWAEDMHVSATGGSLGGYNLPSGKILADVLDHQYYAEGTSLDKGVDAAQKPKEFVIKQAPYDFGSTSQAADVPINGSIPFRVDSPSGNATGYYDVMWYRRTNSGAEHITENRVTGVNVDDTLDVFCVITGADRPSGAMKWQVAVKDYTIKVVPAKLDGDRTVITQESDTGNTGNPADNRLVVTPLASNAFNYVEYKFEVTYNGQPLELNKDYTIKDSSNLAKNAGTHTLTIVGMGNYTGEKSVTWTLEPYELSVEKFCHAQINKTYDGTDAVTDSTNGIGGLGSFIPDSKNPRNPGLSTVNKLNLDKSDYQLSNMKFDSAEAGDRTFTGTMTLKSGGNFAFAGGSRVMQIEYGSVSGQQFVFIDRATIAAPAAKALQVANNHAATYTVDLSALLPKLESPKKYGAVTYEISEIKLDDRYYTSGAKVENGKLILPIQAVKTSEESNIGTVTVMVTSTNYKPVTLTVNLRSVNKRKLGMFVSVATDPIVYGMTLGDIKLSAEATVDKDNQVIPGTIAWEDPLTTVPAAGRATYRWTFTPDDTMHYLTASNTITFLVDKATPTGAPTYTAITTGGKTLADAPLTPNASWPSGTVQWVDKDGKPLPASTQVQANTEYTWSFTPADTANYNGATGSVTLYAVSSGGGGGSSSGSTVKTDTVTNPDGSVTKTETKKDGTKVETTTGKDGSVSKTTTNPNGSSVTENKAADGSTGTVKTDKNGQTTAETKVSAKAVEDAKKNGEPVKAPVEVEASRNSNTAPTVKVELPKNSGDTKVEIPVTNVKPGTVAVLVHADGTEEIVKNSLPTADGIQLTVNGGATVKIVDNSKDFIDTQDHWAKDAIDFVSARGLVNGMNDSIYAPDASTTRAQLWTILARQNNADLTGGATWFENAQNWAKEKGISDGMNPNGTINRAQMVTMLWRAMGQPAPTAAATFTDVSADSYYAQAVAWAIENGITTGVGGGRFDPNSTCTRAQIATFLYRLYLSR